MRDNSQQPAASGSSWVSAEFIEERWMNTRMDRRQFVNRSAAAAGSLLWGGAHGTAKAWAAAAANDDLLSRMSWLNEPASAKIAGNTITVRSRAKTDFWQK